MKLHSLLEKKINFQVVITTGKALIIWERLTRLLQWGSAWKPNKHGRQRLFDVVKLDFKGIAGEGIKKETANAS